MPPNENGGWSNEERKQVIAALDRQANALVDASQAAEARIELIGSVVRVGVGVKHDDYSRISHDLNVPLNFVRTDLEELVVMSYDEDGHAQFDVTPLIEVIRPVTDALMKECNRVVYGSDEQRQATQREAATRPGPPPEPSMTPDSERTSKVPPPPGTKKPPAQTSDSGLPLSPDADAEYDPHGRSPGLVEHYRADGIFQTGVTKKGDRRFQFTQRQDEYMNAVGPAFTMSDKTWTMLGDILTVTDPRTGEVKWADVPESEKSPYIFPAPVWACFVTSTNKGEFSGGGWWYWRNLTAVGWWDAEQHEEQAYYPTDPKAA